MCESRETIQEIEGLMRERRCPGMSKLLYLLEIMELADPDEYGDDVVGFLDAKIAEKIYGPEPRIIKRITFKAKPGYNTINTHMDIRIMASEKETPRYNMRADHYDMRWDSMMEVKMLEVEAAYLMVNEDPTINAKRIEIDMIKGALNMGFLMQISPGRGEPMVDLLEYKKRKYNL